MDFVKLTEELVSALVTKPDMISVKEFPTEEEDFHHIQVMVDNETAKAIRTIVQASAYLNGNKKIKIDIDSF